MSEQILSLTNGSFNCLVNKIVRIEASSSYSKIYVLGLSKPYLACKVLDFFQQQLPSADFVRVHRSHLINKQYISAPQPTVRNGLQLTNGDVVEVSRRKRNVLDEVVIPS
jgi:two-component system, LytTR family, response regulator